MVDLGLKDAGYEYANVDDGWSAPQRGANGSLAADPCRFPSGLPALAAAVHALGLKFGIYGNAGARTCEGLPGSRGFEAADVATFAAAGVDYLKYDNCYADNDDFVVARYKAMREALNAAGRPVVLSLCEWGVAQVSSAASLSCQLKQKAANQPTTHSPTTTEIKIAALALGGRARARVAHDQGRRQLVGERAL